MLFLSRGGSLDSLILFVMLLFFPVSCRYLFLRRCRIKNENFDFKSIIHNVSSRCFVYFGPLIVYCKGIPESFNHKSIAKVVAVIKGSSSPMGHSPFFFLSAICLLLRIVSSIVSYRHCDDHRSSLYLIPRVLSAVFRHHININRLLSSITCLKSV